MSGTTFPARMRLKIGSNTPSRPRPSSARERRLATTSPSSRSRWTRCSASALLTPYGSNGASGVSSVTGISDGSP